MTRRITSGAVGTTVEFRLANVDVTANAQLVTNNSFWCDTTAGPITLTLPLTATKGDIVEIYDVANNFHINPVTINRNGHLIMGTAENLTVNTEGAGFALLYYNAARGWRIFTI
jgi:hypothetical protein